MAILTRENVLPLIQDQLAGKAPSYDLIESILFFLDYAISTKDQKLIESVYNAIYSMFRSFFQQDFQDDQKETEDFLPWLHRRLAHAKPSYETVQTILYFMDRAIAPKDLRLVGYVHEEIVYVFLPFFPRGR